METIETSAADKLRSIVRWLDWQDENFNDKMKTVQQIEQVYNACERHSLDFADNLDWENEEDEEYLLACEINEILGYEYYMV